MIIVRILLGAILVCYLNALVIDPCAKIKCKKSEVACLEKTAGGSTCKCAKTCKKFDEPSYFTSKFGNITLKFDSRVIPLAKQGGASCYQSACMNGGTCYTNYNVYTTQQTTTTTTTSSPVLPPLCSCQAQFSGSRCELYNPGQPAPQQEGWNNLCRVYNDKNMNICQNGGQCVYISDNKVACVCPSTFVGQYCEIPVYEQCNGPAQAQCHREYGTCLPNGLCQCDSTHTGPKCDNRISSSIQVITPSPTQAPTQSCYSNFCQNGGTCRPVNVDPYVQCLCQPNFTGTRCEIYVPPPTIATQPPTPSPVTQSPCQSYYCLNGGTCEYSSYSQQAYCLCPIGYTGAHCEVCLTQPPTIPTQPPTYPTPPPTYPTPPPTYPTQPPRPSPCQSYYCLNGGTCEFSSYSQQAYCLCPIGYTGAHCEVCLTQPPTYPTPPPTYPTPPPTYPTQPPSPCQTQQFCMNGGTCRPTNYSPYAICICPPNYTGSRCEICIIPQTVPTVRPTPPPTQPSPCQTQYCLNGGTCRPTNYAPFAMCICPPNYTGSRCEICIPPPPPTPAPLPPSPCQTQQFCLNGGTCRPTNFSPFAMCMCPPNFTGPKCEICLSAPAPVTQPPPCISQYCQNGGSCQSVNTDPYIGCRCPPNYTGERCEICISGQGNVNNGQVTHMPRCNFTVTLRNEGGYIARMKLLYNIDGITQPIQVSKQIPAFQSTSITIPYYAQNLVVIGERIGLGWNEIFTDSGIDLSSKCTKCYKTWGAVGSPRWEYLLC